MAATPEDSGSIHRNLERSASSKCRIAASRERRDIEPAASWWGGKRMIVGAMMVAAHRSAIIAAPRTQ
jgi:hypothetical protein